MNFAGWNIKAITIYWAILCKKNNLECLYVIMLLNSIIRKALFRLGTEYQVFLGEVTVCLLYSIIQTSKYPSKLSYNFKHM